MRPSSLHKIAVVFAAVALGSAAIAIDAVAAGGPSGAGGGQLGGVSTGDRVGGGVGAREFEHGHYGRREYYPFGYYDGYGDYGSSSNNGCVSLDAYGCEE